MKHLNSIDIVRSLSMLYILIFHCGNYTEEINFQPWGDFFKNGAGNIYVYLRLFAGTKIHYFSWDRCS